MDTANPDQPTRGAYLSELAEVLRDDPSRLSPESLEQVTAILADPGLDSQAAEDLLCELAEDDQALAELWDQVQQEQPDAMRGSDLVRPGRSGRGPTHLWVCPVTNCEQTEKGLGWATVSGKTHCDEHGAELKPVRIADT